jgi:hypothetical protein
MDKLTRHYRKSELEQIQPNQGGFKAQIQVVGIGGKTKWLSITDEELAKLKTLLTDGAL